MRDSYAERVLKEICLINYIMFKIMPYLISERLRIVLKAENLFE